VCGRVLEFLEIIRVQTLHPGLRCRVCQPLQGFSTNFNFTILLSEYGSNHVASISEYVSRITNEAKCNYKSDE
jgi:hypothetical protein